MDTDRKTALLLRIAVLSLCAVAVAFVLSAALVSRTSAFSGDAIVAIAVLGSFALAATNFDVTARADFGMSGNVMVLIASLVVFRAYGLFVGPMIVAICGAIDVAQVKQRAWQKITFNAASDAVAMCIASLAFWAIAAQRRPSSDLVLFIAAAVAALSYLAFNAVTVAVPIAVSCGERYGSVLREVVAFDVAGSPFAVLGLGLGWVYLELGAAVVPLLVVPILIARRTFASYLELKAGQEQTIETLIHALEAKDRYTAGHAQRVATFAEYVGSEFNFGLRRMERLRYASLMHDIGKLIVPNQLLNKPGRLTEAEFERVRAHESVSVELLGRIDFLAPVAGDTTTEAATAAVDETGIVEPAIIHVADAFDAMTSTRSYRRALTQEVAFEELRAGAGTQFNVACVDALIRAIERRGEHYGRGYETDAHVWAVAPPEAGTGSAGLGHLEPDPSHDASPARTHAPVREEQGAS